MTPTAAWGRARCGPVVTSSEVVGPSLLRPPASRNVIGAHGRVCTCRRCWSYPGRVVCHGSLPPHRRAPSTLPGPPDEGEAAAAGPGRDSPRAAASGSCTDPAGPGRRARPGPARGRPASLSGLRVSSGPARRSQRRVSGTDSGCDVRVPGRAGVFSHGTPWIKPTSHPFRQGRVIGEFS